MKKQVKQNLKFNELRNKVCDIKDKLSLEKNFWNIGTVNFIEIMFSVLEYRNLKCKNVSDEDFINLFSLRILAVNIIPASKNNPNKPDQKIIKWNGLEGFEKYWVPKNLVINSKIVSEEIINIIEQYNINIMLNNSFNEAIENEYQPTIKENCVCHYINYFRKITLPNNRL